MATKAIKITIFHHISYKSDDDDLIDNLTRMEIPVIFFQLFSKFQGDLLAVTIMSEQYPRIGWVVHPPSRSHVNHLTLIPLKNEIFYAR